MSLLAEERKRKILELIEQKGKVKVNDLANDFDVSTETVRRYLEELENEQKLKKVYGGAIKLETELAEPPMFEREILRMEEKKRIGAMAVSLVEEGDVIFIDEGSTTLQMVDHLTKLSNITILTNSFPLATMLMSSYHKQGENGDIIFLGGHVSSKHFRASGSLAEKMAKEFFVDKAFISVDGLHLESGITSYDLEKSMLTKIFIKNATKTFVLVDHSKLDVRANYKIESLKRVNYIVSDAAVPKGWDELAEKWLQG